MRMKRRVVLPRLIPAVTIMMAWSLAVQGGTDFEFSPVLDLRVEHNGNVAVVGEEEESDQVTRLTLDLVLHATTPKTTFRASYRPYREIYNDFPLDNTGHLLNLRMLHQKSRRSSINFRLDGARTESQGIRDSLPDASVSFLPRTTIDRVALDVSGRVSGGERYFITWGVGGGINRYDDPEGSYEDYDGVEGTVGWEYQTSQRFTTGLSYTFQSISLETLESTSVHGLYVIGSWVLGRNISGSLQVGAMNVEVQDDSTTELGLSGILERSLTRATALRAGVRQEVSQGIGVGGATLDRGGFLGWRFSRERKVDATVNLGYWRRESLDLPGAVEGGTKALSASESIGWFLTRHLNAGLFHSYTKQESLAAVDDLLATDYHSGGFFLRWEFNPR